MRMFLVAPIALVLAACSTPVMDTDAGFDTGTPVDTVIPDTGTAPMDTNTTCDFQPTSMSTACRILSSSCMTGPVSCPGGTTFPNIVCHCSSIHMGMQVWQCDNVCPDLDAGADASTPVDTGVDASSSDAPPG